MSDSLRLTGIKYRYNSSDKPVVDRASANFRAGEITVIDGPSGGGKSTFLKVAAGALRQERGTVEFGGKKVGPLSKKEKFFGVTGGHVLTKAGVIYIPQSAVGPPSLSVADEVMIGARSYGERKKVAKIDATVALEGLGLGSLWKDPVGSLSGGQRKRVALAAGLTTADAALRNGEKPAILADEPFAGLDPESAESTVEMLRLFAGYGAVVVLISHSTDGMPDFADNLVHFNNGTTLLQAPESIQYMPEFTEAA